VGAAAAGAEWERRVRLMERRATRRLMVEVAKEVMINERGGGEGRLFAHWRPTSILAGTPVFALSRVTVCNIVRNHQSTED
jgi:hypothetical protein